MLKKLFNIYALCVWFFLFIILSCKAREVNYISYYQRVNEIDSIYRFANQPKKAVKKYKKLFRKYEPKNQRNIEELGNYLILADKYNKDFGGEKSLRKLIYLLAPYSRYYDKPNPYYPLFKKYSIDSLDVKNEIAQWRNELNKELIDSVSIAMKRDAISILEANDSLRDLNDRKNIEFLKWTFKNYGFPSQQKIGYEDEVSVGVLLLNLGCSNIDEKDYEYLRGKVLEFVKSGDCPPDYYAQMVDNHEYCVKNSVVPYGRFNVLTDVVDTLWVNKNRKSIGLPSINHQLRLFHDSINAIKKYNDTHPNQ